MRERMGPRGGGARRRCAVATAVAIVTTVVAGMGGTAARAAAGPVAPRAVAIAYPDLQVQVPTGEISVGHPTSTTKSLQFSHVTWNAGAGPLEIRPSYDPVTGIAHATQALYSSSAPGQWTFATATPIVKPLVFASPDDYIFPFSGFTLHQVASGGGVGAVVATSPKTEFCMAEDTYVGTVPNTPALPKYTTCAPSDTLGLQVGWGDKYDYTDGGENFDITGLPDGTYWLRAEADPDHYFVESDPSNNITDTEIAVAGDTVTVLAQTHPSSTPPSVTVTTPGPGDNVNGVTALSATAVGPAAVSSLQWFLDGDPIGAPLTPSPYSLLWDFSGLTPGPHTIWAQAVDVNGFIGTSPGVSVSVVASVGTFTVDRSVTQTGSGTITTPPLSTSASGELLVALVSSDGAPGVPQSVAVSSSGSLTWTRVRQANGSGGDSEIWTAAAASPLSDVTVTSTQSPTATSQSLTVVALEGGAAVGASASASGASVAPAVSLTTTAATSMTLAVGNDFDQALPRTPAVGQVLLSQWLDAGTATAHWTQVTSSPSAAVGQVVTMADTTSAADSFNLAAVEIVPPAAGAGDTRPPSVGVLNPVPGEMVSGTTPVAVSATDNVAVSSVQLLIDGHPLGAARATAPYAFAWDTAGVANGEHLVSAQAVDTSGNVARSAPIAVMVDNPGVPMICYAMDVNTSADGTGTVTVAPFHSAATGELILAFVAAEGPAGAPQSVAVSGGGLSWTLVARANQQAGSSEVWEATAASVLSGATVTSTEAIAGYDQSLTVIAMQGTDGTGAHATASAASGPPSLSLTATAARSLVFGVGNDPAAALGRAVGTNQILSHQWLDAGVGTTWTQNTSVQGGPAGSVVSLGDSAPTADPFNLAAVEVTPENDTTTVIPPVVISQAAGYWMVGSTGTVYPFGSAQAHGNASLPAGQQVTHIEGTADGGGYWVVNGLGQVYSFGDAGYFGGSPALGAGETVTSLSRTASGHGYWLFTNRGRAITYGDARSFGDMSGRPLAAPVLGSVATPSGNGYYMVASDGGIFAFGDAVFWGSMGGRHLDGPVVGLAPNQGGGYWLVASDGGIFAFGGAPFRGSMGGRHLNKAVIGMVAYGDGYLMVASDGGIFDFSSSPFVGSLGAAPPANPIVGVAVTN